MGILRKERERRVEASDSVSLRKVAQLRRLYGIGVTSSWDFVMEMFGWREFRNRKEVGAFPGLTPPPMIVVEAVVSKGSVRRVEAVFGH